MKLAEHVVTWMYFVDDVRDSFEELRNRIELVTKDSVKRPYVLAITSCYRGEGVSTVAAGLAYSVTFAAGEQVLLMNSNRHHWRCVRFGRRTTWHREYSSQDC